MLTSMKVFLLSQVKLVQGNQFCLGALSLVLGKRAADTSQLKNNLAKVHY